LRQRSLSTWLIFAAAALGNTGLYAAFTAAPLVALEIGASRGWSGVPGATALIGTALGSAVLASIMARRGRRAGLRLGWVVGVLGGIGAVAAVANGSFPGLLAGMALIGIAHAANQLARFAAADLHPEQSRPTVLGWLVWAGTIGAALGPSLLGTGRSAAVALDLRGATGGFLVAIVFYVAATLCSVALRADRRPQEDAGAVQNVARLREMTRLPHVRAALVIMIVGQVAMVMMMTMTPLHVSEHGHGLTIVGLVMSSHFVGMFAFAPVIGKIVGRVGSLRAGAIGLLLLSLAAAAAGISPGENGWAMGGALFLLGVGWCFGFVAGSALLTRGLSYSERVRLQGGVDGLVWAFSAVASLGSGALLALWSYGVLALIAGVLAVACLIVLASGRLRLEVAPAQT